MTNKKDDFSKIAKALAKSRPVLTDKRDKFKSMVLILNLLGLMAFLYLINKTDVEKNHSYRELVSSVTEEVNQEEALDSTLTDTSEKLSEKYVSSEEEYTFKWELEDYERIPERFKEQRPSIDDIVNLYGKPSSLELHPYDPDFVFFYYNATDNVNKRVELMFMKDDKDVFRLETVEMLYFPIPEQYQLQFNSDGEEVTRQTAQRLTYKAGSDSGMVLENLQKTYRAPSEMFYSKSSSILKDHESIVLVYYESGKGYSGNMEIIFRFKRESQGKFVLVSVSPDDN